jgi:dolichol-phosphate mannosyltransferase
MKLSVIFPCFNEEENIARIPEILVPELQKLGCDYEILLIDDGSADRSYEAAHALTIPQLRIIRHGKNSGIGAAVKTGIKNASGEFLVILDADYTFHPQYIRDLIARFEKGDVDFVIGSPRLAGYGEDIQKYRVFVSIAANMVYSVLLGRHVTAVSPIFRLYKTVQLKEIPLETNGFDISVEILFRLILAGRKFAEVPTPLGLRQFGESKLNYRKEIIRHLKLVRKIIFWRLRSLFVRQRVP